MRTRLAVFTHSPKTAQLIIVISLVIVSVILAGLVPVQAAIFYTCLPCAISDVRLLPDTSPVPGTPGGSLELSACRDEYESVAFVVYAGEELNQVIVKATDLSGADGHIPASAVDIRIVKCWYQAGRSVWDVSHKQLVPELLLKDDELVRVDYDSQQNYVRSTAENGTTTYLLASGKDSENLAGLRPIDAATLQPLSIPSNTLKQFWVTVHIPEEAASGEYTGSLRLSAAGSDPVQIPLTVTVHPFTLQPPRLIYSIYYRAKLSPDGQPTISSEYKSEEQYLAELRGMRAHGVLYPNLYQGYSNLQVLRRELELRQEAGLANDILFTLGQNTGSATSEDALNSLKNDVNKWRELAADFGYKEVYFYGADEAKGERLTAQQKAWEAVQEAGGKTFVAGYAGTFEAMGDRLNLLIMAGGLKPEEPEKWHSVGSKIFSYACTQTRLEEPELFRRSYGLLLWDAGYDGAMDYAYQHGFGHVWNDFDGNDVRDFNFTYPTINGVVDTIQWEGFREAVDDMRYMATLERAIETTQDVEAADAAQRWLDRLHPLGDLVLIRQEMVTWIKRLGR